jgi:hypothetical protein
MQGPSVPFPAKLLGSLLPNLAMSFTIYNLFHFELQNDGLTFNSTSSYYENYTYTEGLLMLTFDIILYSGIGIYLD